MKSGLILTLVAVIVVFVALTLLYFAYSMIGKLQNHSILHKTKKNSSEISPEEAAAIALALELESDASDDLAAAIAMSIHLWQEESVHDAESYVITIKRKQ